MNTVRTVLDNLETRCPRLGGPVTFHYCRYAADNLPCSRSLICWQNHFPVHEYLGRLMTKEEWVDAFEKPSAERLDRILTIAAETSDRLNHNP